MTPACRSLLCLLPSLVATPLAAQSDLARFANDVHPWKDDAALHDVEFVGTKVGWAVGDHATAWQSRDGGRSWSLLNVPVDPDCSLRSVCFMVQRLGEGQIVGTSQIAWVAGRGTKPFSRVGYGVMLKTTDGGKSWQILGEGQRLPPLDHVQFFGPDEGIAVGEASAEFPTGVLITEDGGLTWRAAPGVRGPGWHAAAFRDFQDGFVVGPRGRISLVAGTNVAPPRSDPGSRRAVRDVALGDDLTGWAVGDGALVLRTENGGVTWESPPVDLPRPLSMFADFSAVASVGNNVWIAGKPGGSVWHSPDGGRTWSSHPTGQSLPVHSLSFSTATHGWAVGALGTILRTEDAGHTWTIARGHADGKPRRAAVLAIHTRADRIPFHMLAKYGGDAGYRTVALVVPQLAEGSSDDLTGDRRLSDAVTSVGGSAASSGWRLPLAIPELDTDVDVLTAEWQKHTEGRLGEVLISSLAAELRTWRPTVVVVEPADNDGVTKLIGQAVSRAIAAAADSTSNIDHFELAGLKPWKVRRSYARTLSATESAATIRPYDLLHFLGKTVDAVSSAGRSKLIGDAVSSPQSESFVALSGENKFTLVAQSFFRSDIVASPGSESRRPLLPQPVGPDSNRALEQATRQKNFRGIAGRMLDEPQRGAQLIAEIRREFRDLPPEQAALQVVHLANDYRSRGEWDLAEAAMIEVIELYPEQPAAAEAMLWLMHLWSSQEMAWQRSRGVQLDARQQTTNRQEISGRVERLLAATRHIQHDPVRVARELSGDPLANLQTVTPLPQQNSVSWQFATMTFWQRQALQMGRLMRKRIPQAYRTHEVTWPLASVLRRQGYAQPAGSIYRRLMTLDANDPVGRLAGGEVWLANPADQTPPHLTYSTLASERPYLDGILSDECWRGAKEIRLTSASSAGRAPQLRTNQSYAFAQIANDDQFLFIAVNVPRAPGVRTDGPQYEGRTHDADHTGFDRIRIDLDIDRDYTTAYTIEVDQRGHVSEACWEDTTWNPKLAVAVDSDTTHWRLEMAIPLEELTFRAPGRESAWAVAIVRTTPHVGWQSWIHPAGRQTQPTSFGLLQFR